MEEEAEFKLSTLRCAVEFGFKGHKKGFNLQKVLKDFDTIIGVQPKGGE